MYFLEGHLGKPGGGGGGGAAREREPGVCSIRSSPGDLQAPEPGLNLERPPPLLPRREHSLALPRPVRKRGSQEVPPPSADGDTSHARPPRPPPEFVNAE